MVVDLSEVSAYIMCISPWRNANEINHVDNQSGVENSILLIDCSTFVALSQIKFSLVNSYTHKKKNIGLLIDLF